MSNIYPRDDLQLETLRNIESHRVCVNMFSHLDEYGCGCTLLGIEDKISICEYHHGYNMGVEAGKDAARNDAWESSQ